MSDPGFGVVAARRRYRILKRCDATDTSVAAELAELERAFPELAAPGAVPALSSGVRATLEGGAVVSAIEAEGATPSAAAGGASVAAEVDAAEQTLRENLRRLTEMAKALENRVSEEAPAPQPATSLRPATSPTPQAHAQPQPQAPRRTAATSNDAVMAKVVAAIQAVDAVRTLPAACAATGGDAWIALLVAVACAVLHQSLFSTTLCDAQALLAAARGVAAEASRWRSLAHAVTAAVAWTARAAQSVVLTFVAYSVVALALRLGGLSPPQKFCAVLML